MKRWILALLVLGVGITQAAEIELPGEKMTKPAISCSPFPDRISAYVWRNWFVVPHSRLAAVIGAKESDLQQVAQEMGLPAQVEVSPLWRRKGYITVLRRNWHLLDYPQMLQLLDMTRKELFTCLQEDDFLWHKMGRIKPRCGDLIWSAKTLQDYSEARERIAKIIAEEGVNDFTEEPRFAFREVFQTVPKGLPTNASSKSPFDLRLIFSYFADYGDPLADGEISSFPEGLLARLAAQGVNAVWLHTVLNSLSKDPKYPEFGAGSEARITNLRKLVARAAKYNIKVYLYMNEPRAQPPDFFEKRPDMKGVTQAGDGIFAMCTSNPETLRWMHDAVKQVFASVPGLGGIFTISMSENLTNCASRGHKHECERCSKRSTADIVAEVNRTLVSGMLEGNPEAYALIWNWGWPGEEEEAILAGLPKTHCRVMCVSEAKMNINRGGVKVVTYDYSISCVGPSDASKQFYRLAHSRGVKTAAKVQANTTWEICTVPYLPVMDLVAEHASNLVKENVDGVMLSWSLGSAPAPNLRVFNEMTRDGDTEKVLNNIATDLYGKEALPWVRQAWREYSDGFRNFPFSIAVAYNGPQQWGAANPLYWKATHYTATMVGLPYDCTGAWAYPYGEKIWTDLMQKVADGFEAGCTSWQKVIDAIPDTQKRELAKKEFGLFRVAGLHFASSADQVRFVMAREKGDRATMLKVAERELARAKEELKLTRADSRIGYESSNHYIFLPQDLREKILTCRIAE